MPSSLTNPMFVAGGGSAKVEWTPPTGCTAMTFAYGDLFTSDTNGYFSQAVAAGNLVATNTQITGVAIYDLSTAATAGDTVTAASTLAYGNRFHMCVATSGTAAGLSAAQIRALVGSHVNIYRASTSGYYCVDATAATSAAKSRARICSVLLGTETDTFPVVEVEFIHNPMV